MTKFYIWMLNVCIKTLTESNDLFYMFKMIVMNACTHINVDNGKMMYIVLLPKTLILSEVCCSCYIKIPKSSPPFVISQNGRGYKEREEWWRTSMLSLSGWWRRCGWWWLSRWWRWNEFRLAWGCWKWSGSGLDDGGGGISLEFARAGRENNYFLLDKSDFMRLCNLNGFLGMLDTNLGCLVVLGQRPSVRP